MPRFSGIRVDANMSRIGTLFVYLLFTLQIVGTRGSPAWPCQLRLFPLQSYKSLVGLAAAVVAVAVKGERRVCVTTRPI